MIPGNVDPRRPDKVQKYKPPATGNGNNTGDDLTPDYMNILGPESTTGNAQGDTTSTGDTSVEQGTSHAPPLPPPDTVMSTGTGASHVIPTSPQYGVAIISENDAPTVPHNNDTGVAAAPHDPKQVVVDATTDPTNSKDTTIIHTTPSKNDRFKVVKIASSEPFKRGRWKCMDYVDQAPPPVVAPPTKTAPAGATIVGGAVYMQTQSLPPQQIQQLLMQGGGGGQYGGAPQYYQQQSQMVPQTQYYYAAQPQSMPQPLLNAVAPNSVPQAYINANQQQQPYYQTAAMPNTGYNVQFVQPYASQGSAFVPTTQNLPTSMPLNFAPNSYPTQQQQQPNVTQSQSQPATQTQPMVNGFAYAQNVNDTTQLPTAAAAASNLPTQVAKNVLLNASAPVQQHQVDAQVQNAVGAEQGGATTTTFHAHAPLQQQQPNQVVQVVAPPIATNSGESAEVAPHLQGMEVEQTANAGGAPTGEAETTAAATVDDPAKTNPVVNAIDNKIEQAMDLVKSHLMYTVREEVEVLKEKIAELMERIQQLESENNFLRSQIPNRTGVAAAAPTTTTPAPTNGSNTTPTSDPSPQQ